MGRKKKEKDEYDETTTCVACGGVIGIKNKLRCKHTCSKTYDAAMQAANTRAYDEVSTRRAMPLWERLDTGFELLEDDEEPQND